MLITEKIGKIEKEEIFLKSFKKDGKYN